jgi:sugar phosphate isomerase/epimerase
MKQIRFGIEVGPHTREMAKELGIKGVPIDVNELISRGDALITEIKNDELEICQIGAFGYNPLHPDTSFLASQTEVIEKAIPLAASTGCPYIVINGGNFHPSGFGHGDKRNFTNDALNSMAERLKPLCELAEEHGAIISIEPYIKSAMSSAAQFSKLSALVGSPALKMNLDVTNFYDLADMWDTQPKIINTCKEQAPHYGLVHVKEIGLKEGFHIHMELCPIDEGATDWELMIREAAPHVPESSWLILEHVGSPEEARRCVPFLRAVAKRGGVELI